MHFKCSLLRRSSPIVVALSLLAVPAPMRCEDVRPADDLPWTEGSTTLVVLPDTEVYANKKPAFFKAQTRWVRDNYRSRNIAYILHVGDVTNNNTEREWRVARECFDVVEGKVPYVLAAGNHDYDNTPGRLTRMNDFFHVSDMQKWPTFGGVYKPGHLENHYHLMEIQGRKWIILSLECGPRNAVIEWANKVLAKHEKRLAIVLTHAYLYYDNQRYNHLLGRQRASPHGFYGEGADGEELWNKLIRRHPNVMIVVCGHLSSGYLGYRADEGDYGNVVHQMMVDYEKMRGGGLGYLRLLEFLPDGKTVQVRTYSPVTKQTNPRDPKKEEFKFELQLATRDEPTRVDGPSGAPLAEAPAHRYSFDRRGGDGTVLADSIGGAHAVLRSEDSVSALNGRGQLVLDGNGRVDLPPGLLSDLRDVSFEVWFTPTADRYSWQSVVRFGDRDDWLTYVFRTLTVHRAEIGVDGHNADIQRKVPIEPGTSLHVAVTYDHDGADGSPLLSYYRNGKQFGKMKTGLRLDDVEDRGHRIGPFPGQFNELRIHARPLTAAEVRGSYEAGPDTLDLAPGVETPESGALDRLAVPDWAIRYKPLRRAPIHRYRFEGRGGDGARISDATGKAHGRLRAAGTDSALDGEGRLVLTGEGHVRLPSRLIRGLEDVSFEVWFTPTAEDYNWNSVVRFGSRNDWLTYVFRTLTVHRAEIAVDRYNEDIQRRVNVKPGTQLHVVITYDRDGADGKPFLSYYRDGELAGNMSTKLLLTDVDTTANTIGPFAGKFDELRIYDYPLDPAEVQTSFEAGVDKLRIAEPAEK